jgi:hypothetical protein
MVKSFSLAVIPAQAGIQSMWNSFSTGSPIESGMTQGRKHIEKEMK